jgi:hypothetical protein
LLLVEATWLLSSQLWEIIRVLLEIVTEIHLFFFLPFDAL